LSVVELGGVTNVGHDVEVLGPRGAGLHISGLYDAPEMAAVRSGLMASGISADGDLTLHGFHGCRRDLEEELLRALGVDAVLRILEQDGEAVEDRRLWPGWQPAGAVAATEP
jgi:hypothetical protein